MKLNCEVELKCYLHANETFNNLLEMPKPIGEALDLFTRAAFLLGRQKELAEHINQNFKYLADFQGEFQYIKLLYTLNQLENKNIEHQQSNQTTNIHLKALLEEENLNKATKSIIYYLLAYREIGEAKLNYLKLGYNCCNYNQAIINELISLQEIPENLSLREPFRNNPTCIKNFSFPVKEKTETDFQFCVIGGGNSIGGSCYVIKLNGFNLMIDAGINIKNSEEAFNYPDFERLKQFGIKDLSEIDALIITHAH